MLVEAAVPRTIDVMLEVGGVADKVTVRAESPVLQRTTPTVTRRLSAGEIESVPTSTRNFTHFLTATAGVSADIPPVGGNDTGAISPSVNGTKQTSNSVLYNGVAITSMLSNTGTLDEGLAPAPETIEEVKVTDQPVRRLGRPERRRKLPARHGERRQRARWISLGIRPAGAVQCERLLPLSSRGNLAQCRPGRTMRNCFNGAAAE